MIPFIYKLRKEVRFEKRNNSNLVLSEIPLNITRISERAVKILKLCNGKRTLNEIAKNIRTAEEEYIFKVCDFFNKKGILEIEPSPKNNYFPSITVIIPTKDREFETIECLKSVFAQEYPKDKFEVIVIDDGSQNGAGNFMDLFPCKVLSHRKSRGQSYCRNLGAKKAWGEILAFLDSDCVAESTWLKDLTVCFQWNRIGAVGGFVDGYFENSFLDRYEKKFSSLNMGKHIIYGADENSTFYIPTCSLLVRKKAYNKVGGIREDTQVGEDVDFCWKMREMNYDLLYVPYGHGRPYGCVKHKHRNSLGMMLKRRAEYGTSEAILYNRHPAKKKSLIVPPMAAVSFFGLCIAILSISWQPALFSIICLAIEAAIKSRRIVKMKLRIPLWKILFSVMRVFFSFFYIISFHLLRYYMLLLLFSGFLFYPIWLLYLFMILISSSVDYFIKKPKLIFPIFLFYYVLEHISYQIGVFGGCLRARSFKSYRTRFSVGANKYFN